MVALCAAVIAASLMLALPAAAQQVALSGVAGGKALVTIDAAAPRFLSPGQAHQGVKLLSLQGEAAVIEVNGQRQTVRVGEAPVSVGNAQTSGGGNGKRVVLTADSQGHFMPPGQINGRSVQFMVDTGASLVALSAADAKRINLNYEGGTKVNVSTANGNVVGYRVQLDTVRVGDAQVYGVPAIVMPQSMPFVLLGNSYLARFQMTRTNDQMVLEKRY